MYGTQCELEQECSGYGCRDNVSLFCVKFRKGLLSLLFTTDLQSIPRNVQLCWQIILLTSSSLQRDPRGSRSVVMTSPNTQEHVSCSQFVGKSLQRAGNPEQGASLHPLALYQL